ncbi:MAG: HAD family phosphatase [Firmicutes bacterium]|nr:HAD family phosphatase [Bacillota bacterium]
MSETRDCLTKWAVIFDCDGVLVDSEPVSLYVLQTVLHQFDIHASRDELSAYCGYSDEKTYKALVSRYGQFTEQQKFLEAINATYRQAIKDEGLPVFPGVRELIENLGRHRIRYALGSSGPRVKIEASLAITGLNRLFSVTVSAEDVTRAKPAPDIFLLCAERLGVNPSRCVVVEDSLLGIEAARQAGMACVAVTNSFPRHMLTAADLIVDELTELSVDMLEDLACVHRGTKGV